MKNICLFIGLFISIQVVNAQVRVNHNTSGNKLEELVRKKQSRSHISSPIKTLPSFDYSSLIEEDKNREASGLPARYGKKFKVDWSISNSGVWSNAGDNKIWQLKVRSSGAFSLSFLFDKFYLPDGATLLIYNEVESFMYGPLTVKNNKKHGRFSTGPIQGETIIIELSVPEKLQNEVKLKIGEIIHGYRNLFQPQAGYNESGSCLDNNDVECFNDWDDESDAVARLINSVYYGSGALVNNTASDYTPYFLTAFHVVDVNGSGTIDATDEQAVSNSTFDFHYKSPTCNGSNSTFIRFTGGDLVASLYASDFALIELDDSPVGNGNIAYLGWDNRNITPSAGTVIHHPSGDVMKISLSNTSPNTAGNFWEYQFYSGITEGGSSGAPVLNQNDRIVGQLLGTYQNDPISCSNQDGLTLYGKFDVSWDSISNNDHQLAHWLDPDDTGNSTTNLLRSPSIDAPDVICYGGHTISLLNPPSGVTITWDGTNVDYPGDDTGTSVTVRAASSSTTNNGTVTASFTINSILHTITHPVWVGKPTNGDIDFGVYFSNPPNNVIARNDYEAIGILDNPNESLQGVTKYNWQFGGWSSYITDYQTYPLPTNSAVELYLDNYASGSQIIMVYAENTCGTDMMMAAGKMFVTDDYGMYMTMSPNPTSGETTLTIESTSKEEIFDENTEWELEVYSPSQALKEKITSIKGKSTIIQTQSWKEGIYVVRVKYKNEILTGKLVVKK